MVDELSGSNYPQNSAVAWKWEGSDPSREVADSPKPHRQVRPLERAIVDTTGRAERLSGPTLHAGTDTAERADFCLAHQVDYGG